MIALIQRVNHASVDIDGECVGKIGRGLLVLLGVEQHDTPQKADQLLDKLLKYRVFPDKQGKMNWHIQQAQGELLIVSQFTLIADTKSGTRPSFSRGAPPNLAMELYDYFCQKAAQHISTQTGQFAADMQVNLQNDGPVTFWLQV